MNRALTLKEVGRVRRALAPLRERFPSQASLARALGVSQQTVSAVLSGAQFPGMRFALGVARARGLSLEALLTTPSAGCEAPLETGGAAGRAGNEAVFYINSAELKV
jgi:transcriptional regulator with XRE-family HTH domain